jgi:protein-S-isoprenylcysteine O-methyltransferase Ste14
MAVLALSLLVVWIGLVAGVPSYLSLRRTGTIDVVARGQRGSPQWWARWISSLGFVFAVAAPIAELAGWPVIALLDRTVVGVLGVVLVVVGIFTTLSAQLTMGASWRGDVDPEAQTELVTTGLFRIIRNPIFTGTAITAIGLALMVPNVLAVAMLIAFVTAWEIQVRLVEEPYLLRVHGEAYRRYAARTGRFVPWVGRLVSRAGQTPHRPA